MRRPAIQKSTLTDPPAPGLLPDADPVVALWAPGLGAEIPLPQLPWFVMGREGCDVLLPHASVSRRHARVERSRDGLRATDLGSKNGIEAGGARVTSTPLEPGRPVKLGQIKLWPLTRSQRDARRVLAYAFGYGADADALIMDALGDAAMARSFVVVGDATRDPQDVVEALIAASPRRMARRVDVSLRSIATRGETARDVASGLRHGVVTVELEVLAKAGETASSLWQRTLADPHWDLMVVWHGDLGVPAWPAMPRMLHIPTVEDRVRGNELARMISHLFSVAGTGWRADDLPRVGFSPARQTAYAWDGNHAELRQMVAYAIERLGGESHAGAARNLGLNRGRLARMASKWGLR